jgi:uncharacterized membrane protein
MSRYLIAYAGALVVLLALDFLWLGLIMRGFYKSELGELMRERPNMLAAGLFYVVYVVGVVIFATAPALNDGQWLRALIMGGLFGFFAYFTYDMVNFATLKGYSVKLVMVDVAWGIFVTAISATAGYVAVQWFAR